MEDIIVLPQAIVCKSTAQKPIIIHNYTSYKNLQKSKVLLQYNLITFLINGEKSFQYANNSTSIDNKKLAVLSSGNCLMTEKLSNGNNYSSIVLFFDNAVLMNFFIKYPVVSNKAPSKNEAKAPFIILEKDDFVKNFLISIDLIKANTTEISDGMLLLKFEEIMLYLLEKSPEVILSLQASLQTQQSDFEIRKLVEQNIQSNLTIEELAFLGNMSVSTFKRRFAKIYNCSPSQFFLQKRMEIAADLLVHNQENPSEVFYKVGYENHSSFSLSFKQIYGMSPKQYQLKKLTDSQ
ncbi:helix-turn-helix domain-containing protein [Solitalea canadensis]|uniref:DNA-binding domain-containing protein, AraC-type n=1 Tax=Solitalea canadensis (strain ATCC 29591 / DSM 3403 / JCM 21819 / LMG 8368 / NBRC 15130 / NCIMB 12057 / USAM 9D) TaxID=929556 RepID=H8KM13_SOLCM|nr:DNA-binding domain-containing protein, AraC-type [Solitalea canadensis DSM 3403]